LRQLLASTCPPEEIWIVDNGRSSELPGTPARIPRVDSILYPEGNVGCAGLNLAFAQATGKYVFCFDDDSFPAPIASKRLFALLKPTRILG